MLVLVLCSVYAWTSEGKLLWTYATQGKVIPSPAIGPDGTVYVPACGHTAPIVFPGPDWVLGLLLAHVHVAECVWQSVVSCMVHGDAMAWW